MLPIELEKKITVLEVGSEIKINFSSPLEGLYERYLNSPVSKENGHDDNDNVTSTINKNNNENNNNNNNYNNNNNAIGNKFDLNNNCLEGNLGIKSSKNKEIKTEENKELETEEDNKKKANEVDNINIYRFRIKLISKEKSIDPTLAKKVKSNLFYPSLAVQVRTYTESTP